MGRFSSNSRLFADMLQNELQVETRELTPLEQVFNEQFLPLDRFIADHQFMDMASANIALSEIQMDLLLHCEQILKPQTYIEMVKEWGIEYAPVRYVNDLVACWGKGSGKDMSIQFGFARAANILLCMNSPQAYYEMPGHTIIHMMNVAASSKQAHGVFFKPLRALLTNSPWYADKFEGELPGPQATEIRFKKNIDLVSGHSDAETLEGKNLLLAVADEISAFAMADSATGSRTAPTKTAEGLIDMLKSSATTRFGYEHKVVQISYPRAKGDAILKALEAAKDDEREMGEKATSYASGPYRTWDVNPRFKKLDFIEIPGVELSIPNLPSIIKDYKKNIAFARAKYECAPDAALNRYIRDDLAIFSAFSRQRLIQPITFQYRVGRNEAAGEVIDQWQCDFAISPDFMPIPGAIYAIHADMSLNGDRAGVAMCHVSDYREMTGLQFERRPVVDVDFVNFWEADNTAVNPMTKKSLPREVQLRWLRQLVAFLQERRFPIGLVTLDGWQSVDSIQIMQARGVEAEKFSLDRTPEGYKTLRDVLYESRLQGYTVPDGLDGTHSSTTVVTKELQTLNQYPNGKIDHLPGGSKDVADALAGAVRGAILLGGQDVDPGDATEVVQSAPMPEFESFGGWGQSVPSTFGTFGR